MNFRLSPSCQFFFHYEVTRIARVHKHASTNDNSLDLGPFNRKLALVGIILIKFSSLSAPTKIEELTAGSDEKREENLIRMIPTRASLRLKQGLFAEFSCFTPRDCKRPQRNKPSSTRRSSPVALSQGVLKRTKRVHS